ncbi:MAG: hypothetical protein CSA42_07990 [Gammaproteobacteria bacterium]|nr:MAG: hypothetical protein CSA42_07990 [Gammaproteobacteria bacterium]
MKLYILGNGFDINHGIPCKYPDFYNYLKQNRNDVLEVMEKYYYVDSDSELWWKFECNLEENISYESLVDIIGEYTPNFMSDNFRDGDWYDAQIYIEQDCDDLLKHIRSGFEDWINSLRISNLKKKYQLDMTACFITFNYTEVLEKVYGISTSNILHIHNKVGEKLVFGHGKRSENFNVKKALYGDEQAFLYIDEDGNVESNEVGHEQFAEHAVCAFYDKMRKHTEDILPIQRGFIKRIENIDEIIILGHSYNEIDFPYFEEVTNYVTDSTKWTLCYFSDEDKQFAEQMVEQLTIQKNLVHYKHSSEMEQVQIMEW